MMRTRANSPFTNFAQLFCVARIRTTPSIWPHPGQLFSSAGSRLTGRENFTVVEPAGRRESGECSGRTRSNRRPAGAYSGAVAIVAWCSVVRCSTPSEYAVGRVVAAPWWSHNRHPQTTVSTDAIASMLITSVAGRQTVMGVPWVVVMLLEPAGRREPGSAQGRTRSAGGQRVS